MRVLLCFMVALTLSLASAVPAAGPVREGDKLPNIVLKDVNGKYVFISKLCDERTKNDQKCAVVINVFKIVCKPCELELPALKRFQKDWADKGAVMVLIGYGENEQDLKKFVSQKQLEDVIVLTDRYGGVLEKQLRLGKKVPRTIIADSSMNIKTIIVGGTKEIYKDLSMEMEKLL